MKLEEVLRGGVVNNSLLYAVDSSALLCLLVFHRMDRFNPLRMEVAGRMVVFEGCFFGGGRSDGVTVLLFGRYEDTGRLVRLYLESEFVEYLRDLGDVTDISGQYEAWYKKVEASVQSEASPKWDVRFDYDGQIALRTLHDVPAAFKNVRQSVMHYCQGIKQMISHFIDVSNSLTVATETDLYLGTILFDFTANPSTVTAETRNCFADYAVHYAVLAQGLNRLTEGKFTVLPTVLTYQEVFAAASGYKLDTEVRQYYGL